MRRPQRARSRTGAKAVRVPEETTTQCVERGNFTHGVCAECGWEGPARRARNVAIEDAGFHALTGCGLDVVVDPAPDGVARPEAGAGPEVEGVPDRERLSARGRS